MNVSKLTLIAAVSLAGLVFLLLTVPSFAADTNELNLIPLPQKIQRLDGEFKLTPSTRIYVDSASRQTGELLAARLRQSTGYEFPASRKFFADEPVKGGILLTTKSADANLGLEGYELTVNSNSVVIRAPEQAGLFYGAQTLLQLLPTEIFSTNTVANFDWQAPCVQIEDQPRFKWRGLMLDVSRHFYSKSDVEKILDTMALYKLNVFHWHLVDNQGWRIQIEKYPKLTEIGAWRSDVAVVGPSGEVTAHPDWMAPSADKFRPDGRYGGFYTPSDIREVVAYAAARHITIVPEIEMPGHSAAALTAYPQFGQGEVYNPVNEGTFQFLDDVLTEVFELFPGKYIHLGGDEVDKGYWNNNPACQALMKREGLKNGDELQSWFEKRMEKFVNAHGKTMIGWSEIARGGLATNAVVMDWIGGAKEAASAGHDVVMSPAAPVDYCYFDHYQSTDHSTEPLAFGYLPLKQVYSFEPIPAGLAPEFQKHILGAQGNLWTEYVASLPHAEYMIFPRACALAEATWSPKDSRNWDDFQQRLKANERCLNELGVNYRPDGGLGGGWAGVKVGGWQPSQITTTLAPMEWDVTTNVTAAGAASVRFNYSEGADGIDIAWAALLENGQEISRDTHNGFTGGAQRNPVYSLAVPAPEPGAKYTLRAEIAGDGGADSRGDVLWIFKLATSK